jgi:GMP synthase-like glutamine amidotransferase
MFVAMQLLQSRPNQVQVNVDVFDVMKQKYPENYAEFDAFVISGCVSAAYDPDPWIHRLQVLIDR